MSAPTRTPRDSWITEGLRALAFGGPDDVRVEALAKALGVTKGGFYWHFQDRQGLLEEMLDTWERTLVDQVIDSADRGNGCGRARLRRLFAIVGEHEDLRGLELAVRDWARRDAAVAKRVTRVDNRRLDYLRPLFAEFCDDENDVEGRCLLVLTFFVGQPYVAATQGPRHGRSATAAALRHLLR